MKQITLLFFFFSSSLIFAQTTTTIGESTLFSTTTNATYTHFYEVSVKNDGNTGAEEIFEINITTLPAGGADYRIAQSRETSGWENGSAQTLSVGLNTITIAAVSYARSVKIQFTSADIEFDSIELNENNIYPGVAPGAPDCISTSTMFTTTTNATWLYALSLCAISEGASSQSAQNFVINVTSLPSEGADYRVVKSLANPDNWYQSNSKTLSLGLNTITVAGTTFDRSVKIQFSSGDICFDTLTLNNISDDTAIDNSELFDDVDNETWKHSITMTTPADGVSSQSAQTLVIDITKMPGVASYRVVKTLANGNFYNSDSKKLSVGLNSITVPEVAFDRTVKIQFTTGENIEYNSITINGNPVTLGIADYNAKFLVISPNPSTDIISISGIENIKSIKVYSILGALEKEVFKTNQIDVSELSSGIHIVKVDNGTVFSKKIIKQ